MTIPLNFLLLSVPYIIQIYAYICIYITQTNSIIHFKPSVYFTICITVTITYLQLNFNIYI